MNAHAQQHPSKSEPPLAERLKEFRKSRGINIDEFAQLLEVPAYWIRRWETGTARPGPAEAARLTHVGFGPLGQAETNIGSTSRIKAKRTSDVKAHEIELRFSAIPGAVVPSWMRNGPPDQDPFHLKLIELQLPATGSIIDPERLSLIDSYDGIRKTAQALLESPKPTAAAWNSNYGSHGWHRYIGRFPPHLVRALLNHFGATPTTVVCDPFAGSGTTAVECRLLGIPFVGVEICALSHLMTRVKAGFVGDRSRLTKLADDYESYMLKHQARAKTFLPESYSIDDVLTFTDNVVPRFQNIEKWFTPEAFLGVSLTMSYGCRLSGYERDALHLALSAKMRSIGNLDVDVVRAEYSKTPRVGVDVGRLVSNHLRKMSRDVSSMVRTHSHYMGEASSIKIIEGSALSVDFEMGSIDFIITSPPYGVEAISYLRTHLLSYRSLSSVLSHDPYDSREQTIGSEYLEEAKLPADLLVEAVSPTFRSFFEGLPSTSEKSSRLRRIGMMKFFEDMHVMGQRMASWLKDGGRIAFIVGNKRLGDSIIPTDKIIEESFRSSGLILYDAVRHKLKTNNSNSQVPWQERIIQEEATMLFQKGAPL